MQESRDGDNAVPAFLGPVERWSHGLEFKGFKALPRLWQLYR